MRAILAPTGVGNNLTAALGWNTGGLAVQAAFQLTFGLLLARILGPTPYGLMAMAWIVLTPATILADAGLGLALVQKQELTTATINYSFCVQTFVALVMAISLCAVAPLVARFFATPDLTDVLIVSSSILLVQAFGLTSVNLLRRCLDFRRLQIVQMAALLASTVFITLPLAFAGFGVWSLIAGILTNYAIISLGATALTPSEAGIRRRTVWILITLAASLPALIGFFGVGLWKIVAVGAIDAALVAIAIYAVEDGLSLQELRRQGSFGNISFRFLVHNVINASADALPALVIGRLFGVASVGIYDRAFALIIAPVDRIASAVSTVLFSHFADLHRAGMPQTSDFLRWLTIAFFAGLPFATGVFENRSLIIDVALGAQWMGAVPIVPPMAALVVLILARYAPNAVLNARGRPEIEFAIQLASMVPFLVAVTFVGNEEPAEILWALVAAYGICVLCLLAVVSRFLAVRTLSICLTLVPGGVTAVLVFAANRVLSTNVPASISKPGRLAAMIGISAAILLFAWLTSERGRRGWFPRITQRLWRR